MSSSAEPRHRMKIVAQRSGLSPHVIRVWEKRYDAVEPDRSETNRRLYSDDDIARLALLRALTESGHSIGQIASLTTGQLKDLARQNTNRESELFQVLHHDPGSETRDDRASDEGTPADFAPYLEQALAAARRMDQQGLEDVMDRAVVALGYSGLIERLAGPLITSIGEEWHTGSMTAAQEHAASSTIRTQIEKHTRGYSISANAPCMVVTTPQGQLHELGAVLVTAVARKCGWRVVYLGPSLPAAEIAGAVAQSEARALALSISYPADDGELGSEIRRIRKLVGDDLLILAGGRAAHAYRKALDEAKMVTLSSLSALREHIEDLRRLPPEIEAG